MEVILYRVFRLGPRPKGAVLGMVVTAVGWEHAREVASLAATGRPDSVTWTDHRLTDTELLGYAPKGETFRVIMTEYAR